MERYDAVVIGGGMAGLPMALRAARHGRVAFVEKEKLGGTCLNRGCIPTKTMIASATVAHQVRRAAEFGVKVGVPDVNLAAVVARKDQIVSSIRDGSYRAVERAGSLNFFPAQAQFVGPRRLRVDHTEIEATKQFRRVNGHLHLRKLRDTLDAQFAALSMPHARMRTRRWPNDHLGPPPKFYGTRDILTEGVCRAIERILSL